MASRKEQKEQARAARLAQEQQAAEQAQRTRRLQIFGGVIALAVVVIVAAIAISSGGSTHKGQSAVAKAAVAHVNSLLAGIPQSGNTLGKPNAPITITEYGDLECSICDELATPASFTNPESQQGTGWEDKLITEYVRTGKAKLVFRSMETASSSNPDANAFTQQQVAAEAAGLQGKEWNFIELMYNQQGAEGTNYVSESYLQGLAKEIPGLNFKQWMADRKLARLKNQLSVDNAAGVAAGQSSPNGAGTPTIVIKGPLGQSAPIVGLPNGYGAYVSAINRVG